MRGANDGDQALVTLDFRDQNMWSVPVDSTETTVDLTTDWVKHTFAGTAPDDSVMPVFHTRFTMAAASGTVEIDGLGMTTE